MAVRIPPDNRVPPVKGRPRPRVVRYEEPRVSFWRRWMRRIFRPWVVISLAIITTLAVSVLGYYYYVYSERIDKLLRGEIFTRSAGIYAAPRELRAGENLSQEEFVQTLTRMGYVDRSAEADDSRGRYTVNGATIEIEPSADAAVDGQRAFPRARVAFARGGKSIQSVLDLERNANVPKVQLEPELITSVTGANREKRKVVGFQDLPAHLVKAITVTEDRTFFDHYGINFRGIFRALIRRYEADQSSPIARQGGSSITQQLVKNLLLSPEKTMSRKIAEAYMSVILETRLTKQEIFTLYANEAYLGQRSGFSINGFGEAASVYFNKDVTKLTLAESAFLAGIIRSPNRYNPYRDPETALARRNQVLTSMVEAGAITELESARAQSEELKVANIKGRLDQSEAPYFVDFAQEQLGELLADRSAAERLRIYTTIDMDLQRAAYTAVNRQLAALDKLYAKRIQPGTLQAALVAMNARTGEVVAMVGGRDYEKSQLNRATDALRQPGSVFKPFVYATALNTAFDPVPRVITPATTYLDAPKTFTYGNQTYSPGNYGDAYSNVPVTLRDALVKSLNVVTVDVATEVTIGRVMNLAAKAGLPKPRASYPSMALGTSEATPLQMASAYTAFANNGTRTTPLAINRITNGNGVTVVAPTAQRNEVMRPEISYIMTSMMKDVVERGTAARLRQRGFKANVAGKTGTSRDGWFAGYTPEIVCVVYVGFDDGSQLGLTGAESALPIWSDFMIAALSEHPEWAGDWQAPGGIVQAEINPQTGALATAEDAYRRTEIFVSGTVPTQTEMPYEELPEGTIYSDGEQPIITPPVDPAMLPNPQTTLPSMQPTPPAARRNAPRLEGRGEMQPDGTSRLTGTITLDIDPTTGLIAAPTCPIIRSQTFQIGREPKAQCSPAYHTGRTNLPASTRPRSTLPSP